MTTSKTSAGKTPSGSGKTGPVPESGKSVVKKSSRKTRQKSRLSDTVVIDGVTVKILRPAVRGSIPAAEIRKAIAAVQKAKQKAVPQKTGE